VPEIIFLIKALDGRLANIGLIPEMVITVYISLLAVTEVALF